MATPSAPSAAAVNEVAIEKNRTVPPSRTESTLPSSVPGTLAQFTTRSKVPPAPSTARSSRDRVGRVHLEREVAEPGVAHGLERAGGRIRGDEGALRPEHLARAGEHEGPGLPGADHEHALARREEPRRERGRPAHVERGERDLLREIVREARPRPRREQDRLAVAVHPLERGPDRADPVEPQRGEGERDERHDPVARAERRRRRVARPDRRDAAEQHASRPRDRVVELSPGADDPEDLVGDPGGVAARGVLELPERGGVHRERLDRDRQLVLAERERGVEDVRPLGERARWRDDSAESVRVHATGGR